MARHEKMFGQIYVENRETIPRTIAAGLINAVVAMEDTKFYQHVARSFGIIPPTSRTSRGSVARRQHN